MGRTRSIYFELNDKKNRLDFGTYALMMYYAKQTGSSYAKYLYEVTLSEYQYRVYNDLPLDGVDEDDEQAHFVIDELEKSIQFIDNVLVPALKEEKRDLIEKYGGWAKFNKVFYVDMQYLQMSILDDESYTSDPEDLVYTFIWLRDFIKDALFSGSPFSVDVR